MQKRESPETPKQTVLTLSLPTDLAEQIRNIIREKGAEALATVLKYGIEEMKVREAIALYKSGKTLIEAARMVGMSLSELVAKIEMRSVPLNRGRLWSYGMRAALISERTMRAILNRLSPSEQYDLGREMGYTVQYVMKIDTWLKKHWSKVFDYLIKEGFGDIELNEEEGLITVRDPFFTLPVTRGYLETALGVRLEVVESSPDKIVFKILEPF